MSLLSFLASPDVRRGGTVFLTRSPSGKDFE